jgi:hypothetical protein
VEWRPRGRPRSVERQPLGWQVCTYTHTHKRTHIQLHTHTHTYTHTYTYIQTRAYTHTHTHKYTHTHKHTHTHTHREITNILGHYLSHGSVTVMAGKSAQDQNPPVREGSGISGEASGGSKGYDWLHVPGATSTEVVE